MSQTIKYYECLSLFLQQLKSLTPFNRFIGKDALKTSTEKILFGIIKCCIVLEKALPKYKITFFKVMETAKNY